MNDVYRPFFLFLFFSPATVYFWSCFPLYPWGLAVRYVMDGFLVSLLFLLLLPALLPKKKTPTEVVSDIRQKKEIVSFPAHLTSCAQTLSKSSTNL